MKGVYTVYCSDGEVFIFVILKHNFKSVVFRNKLRDIKQKHGIAKIDIEPFFEVIE